MNKYFKVAVATLLVAAVAAIAGRYASKEALAQDASSLPPKLSSDSGQLNPQNNELARLKGSREAFPELSTAPQLQMKKVYHFIFVETDDTDFSNGVTPKLGPDGKPLVHFLTGPDAIFRMDEGQATVVNRGTLISNQPQTIEINAEDLGGFEKLMGDQLGTKQLWVIRTKPTSKFPDFVLQAPADELAELIAKYSSLPAPTGRRTRIRAVWETSPAPAIILNDPASTTTEAPPSSTGSTGGSSATDTNTGGSTDPVK